MSYMPLSQRVLVVVVALALAVWLMVAATASVRGAASNIAEQSCPWEADCATPASILEDE